MIRQTFFMGTQCKKKCPLRTMGGGGCVMIAAKIVLPPPSFENGSTLKEKEFAPKKQSHLWWLIGLVIRRLRVQPLLGRQHSFVEI